MKRYVCTVASAIVLALVGTGTATAGLPLPGGSGSQLVTFGDQSVGEQSNTADVTQAQGNGNLNIAPAVAIFGDAKTENAQGNGNTAVAAIDQRNAVEQSQRATQEQTTSGCCDGTSQAGEQSVSGGDQSVGEQSNTDDVEQKQGNGNVNVSPAIAVFGDAETVNDQGNGNDAVAVVDQSNDVKQTQSSLQKVDGGVCCASSSQAGLQLVTFGDQSVGEQSNTADVTQAQGNGNLNIAPAVAIFGDAKTENAQGNGNTAVAAIDQRNAVEQSQRATQEQPGNDRCCWKPACVVTKHPKPGRCDASSGGTQTTTGGEQTVEKQRNEATVTQKQGNRNASFAPSISLLGGEKGHSCSGKCKPSPQWFGGDAETSNWQGNGNVAGAWVDQRNSVDQSQVATQLGSVVDRCGGLIRH